MTSGSTRPSQTAASNDATSPQTRDRILDAAAEVMRSHGLARTTTKAIARAAGFSEATLYKHFADKEELYLTVLRERLPGLPDALAALPQSAGHGDLADRLTEVACQAVRFYTDGVPVAASVFAEPQLLAQHRAQLAARDAGPHRPVEQLTRYLEAEQRQGRLPARADPTAFAALLLGACFQRGFLAAYSGRGDSDRECRAFAQRLVSSLLPQAPTSD